MTEDRRKNLENLSKEQLLYLLEQYYDAHFHTSVAITSVDESEITPAEGIEKIKEYTAKAYFYLLDEHLGDRIDFLRGVLMPEEYRKIALGE